jgi:hypothetical protein
VQFLVVYIREAHPLDGVLPERHSGRYLGGTPDRHLFVEDPVTYEERLALAKTCATDMAFGYPVLVDGLDDAVNTAYAAWPERLYLVDLDGTLLYQGERGPEGFLPDELEQVLERCTPAWDEGRPAGDAALPPTKSEKKPLKSDEKRSGKHVPRRPR